MKLRPALLALVAASALAVSGLTAVSSATAAVPATTRIAGADRYSTAVELAQSKYSSADTVFIATGTNFPDALGAGAVAAFLGAPLLLTDPNALPAVVKQELITLHPTTIVIVGGAASVSTAVANQLHDAVKGAKVTRIAGADRYATGRAIVAYGYKHQVVNNVFVATGANFPDALSAAAAGGAWVTPVILVNGAASTVDSSTKALLQTLGVTNVKVLGGTGVVSAGMQDSLASLPGVSVSRVAGVDRYDTSVKIAQSEFGSSTIAYLATGTTFPDALAGSAIARAPLFTVPSTCVPQETLDELSALHVSQVVLIGGTSTLSASVASLTACNTVQTVFTSTAPVPSGGVKGTLDLQASSCFDPSTCVIAGDNDRVSGASAYPYLLSRNAAGTWSAQVAPVPVPLNTVLSGQVESVSCGAAGSCVATGSYSTNSTSQEPFIDVLANGSWTSKAVPVPSGQTATGGDVASVSCVSASFCAAVGSWRGAGPTYSDLLTWNGSSWTAVAPPVPPSAIGVGVSRVSCSTATDCAAVGTADNESPIIETWNGSSWHVSLLSLPTGITGGLTRVSCDATGVCAAGASPSMGDVSIAAIRVGGVWTTSTLKTPSSAAIDGVDSVSCAGGHCVLTGYWQDAADHVTPFMQAWNGSTWVATPVATLGGQKVMLGPVSCFSATGCVTSAGVRSPATAGYETSTGSAWSATTVAHPGTEVRGPMTTSCTAAGLCVVAYLDSGPNRY